MNSCSLLTESLKQPLLYEKYHFDQFQKVTELYEVNPISAILTKPFPMPSVTIIYLDLFFKHS